MDIVVWVADVGSIKKKKFGWCKSTSPKGPTMKGTDIVQFVNGIANDISEGKRIALGFECPLFVPITDNPIELSSSRMGEGDRAWSATAGSGALAVGLTETVWVFEQLKKFSRRQIVPSFNWDSFMTGQGNLYIWEAFVTKEAKGLSHCGDAEVAASTFWDKFPDITGANSVKAENPFSLAGAALLRAGITTDLNFLLTPLVVIRS
jgi:hypothetical protein